MSAKNNNQKRGDQPGRLDRLKWWLVLLITAFSIVADYRFSQLAWPIRVAGGLVVLTVLVVIISQTKKGALAWGFVKGARQELRKVSWPTRSETTQTTLIVVVMVIVTALVLWGCDSLFMWLISCITR
jgi:preprotein translocase subunit SecE